MITVLVISGKHNSVNNVMVKHFNDKINAQKFVETTNENADKRFFTCAEIIEDDKKYRIDGSHGTGYPSTIKPYVEITNFEEI